MSHAKKIAWHDQARRMYASGGYSKAAVGRHFGVSPAYIYEVLDPNLYSRAQASRIERQTRRYAISSEFRERCKARSRVQHLSAKLALLAQEEGR